MRAVFSNSLAGFGPVTLMFGDARFVRSGRCRLFDGAAAISGAFLLTQLELTTR
jgi:hypothetical protein